MSNISTSGVKGKTRALTVDDFLDKTVWAGRKRRDQPAKCVCRPFTGRRCPVDLQIAIFLDRERQRQKNRERSRLRKAAGPDFYDRVKRAFGYTCQYCGAVGNDVGVGPYRDGFPTGGRWSIDRIDPGGIYEPANVTLACVPCNAGKQNRRLVGSVRSLADVEAAS